MRRFAVGFLVLQGAGSAVWWLVTLLSPSARAAFVARGAPEETLLAFLPADALLFSGGALAAAWGLSRTRAWAWPVLCVHAGAAVYAGLYCLLLALLTRSAWPAAALMLPSVVVSPVLVWQLWPGGPPQVSGRPAREASPGVNVLKTLLQSAAIWTVFLAVLPALVWLAEDALGLARWRFSGWRVPAIILFVAASAVNLYVGVSMAVQGCGTPLPLDCPRRLVIAGPYAYVRNPMAMAALSQAAAVGLYMGSPAVLLYVIAGGVVWNFLVRPWEEADLERRFGDEYRAYRAQVRCWFPRRHPYVPGKGGAR